MATLIAYQDGNFTGATTFKGLVGGTGSAQETITASTNTTTAYVSSSAFTVTNTHVIEGVMVHCRRLNTTGTVSVALSDDNGTTQTREVTVDAADLPDQNSWVFFKFATTLTGDGGNDYRVQVRGSSAGNAVFFRDATAGNWARLLRRDTTATIATTDDVYISGERTGAGSVTPITVTMDSTATTSYGAMNIGDAGTVSFGTSASTNYYLRLAGNLQIRGNGTLNIGTSTTQIPSTSTATVEFNVASQGQFGLTAFNGSNLNIYGQTKNYLARLTTTTSSGDTVLNVTDTTGWQAGDEIVVSGTTRTATVTRRTISTVDSSTQITLTSSIGSVISGETGYQAAVLNLTRNVAIRGLNATTLVSFVDCIGTAQVYISGASFYFLGRSAQNVSLRSARSGDGVFDLRDSTVYDSRGSNSYGLKLSDGSSQIVRNVGIYNTINGQCVLSNGCDIDGLAIVANQQISLLTFGTPTCTLKNILIAGANPPDFATGPILDVDGFEFFGTSATFTPSLARGAIKNGKFWRNASGWIQSAPIVFDTCEFYHNANANLSVGSDAKIINSTFNGGTGQSLGESNRHVDVNGSDVVFENCDFGQTNQAANFSNITQIGGDATFIDCDIAEGLDPLNRGNLFSATNTPVIGLDKLNSTSGNHRAYKQFGYAGSDQSVYRTASPSEVLVPNDVTGKLPSGSKKFGVANGNSATVSVWVRKSSTYNGAEPRLILKRNIVGGVTSDQVLATLSGGTEEWLELTASTPTVTDDCVLEVYVDCDGTAGTVNVDDYSIS